MRATHESHKLRRAQELLRHAIPNGEPAEIFDRALTLLLKHLERTRLAGVANPRPARGAAEGSRHIPAVVNRAVWARKLFFDQDLLPAVDHAEVST